MKETKTVELGGRTLSVEVGRLAKQAGGAAYVSYGETVVLATVVASAEEIPDRGFFPLTVDYREKAYAAGRIPGGFFKREGRPTDKETLSARVIDRAIRPLFPKECKSEIQVMVMVLSTDHENDADVLGLVAASTALTVSDAPFQGPIAAVRIGKIDGSLVVNPTRTMLEESTLDLVVAGSQDSIMMVEGAAKEMPEDELLEALMFGHSQLQQLLPLQQEIADAVGKPKREFAPPELPDGLLEAVEQKSASQLQEIIHITDRTERNLKYRELKNTLLDEMAETYPDHGAVIAGYLHDLENQAVRQMMLTESRRLDGRDFDTVREITSETSVLPRTHGSALFSRGGTQALAVTTLGTKMDEQKIENLMEDYWKNFMLHYNFPPFSVGEVRRVMGPGRREIGHGRLAERALESVIPNNGENFPYTIRIVSDILESNGSSSMATVCAGSMSLMDAGVPIPKPVGGIAMGLIKEGDTIIILTDILGDEDHLGDMDFKVAGSTDGITAVQMDIKIDGVSADILKEALEKARLARLHVIEKMNQTIAAPRETISEYAPKIMKFSIDVDSIGMVIGPGGKMIREIQSATDSDINIDDDGIICISATTFEGLSRAKETIDKLLEKPEVGKVYTGKVRKITNFGAFLEILPGKDGLLHISEIDHHRIGKVEDVLKMGQDVQVKIKNIDAEGKIDLSRKALLERPKGNSSPQKDSKRYNNKK